MRSYKEKLKKLKELKKLKTIHFGRLNFGSIPGYCRFPPAPEHQLERKNFERSDNFVNSFNFIIYEKVIYISVVRSLMYFVYFRTGEA